MEKTCEILLTSKTAWYSKMCALIWKEKVTKSGRSIFQLHLLVPHTKEKEFGFWRTPDAASGGSNLPGIKKALDQGHMKRPSGHSIHLRLEDQVKEPRLWPTPVQDDVHHRKNKYQQGGTALSTKVGGKLNPTWVEWLMGYPAGIYRLRALGNSIVPQIAEEIGKAIMMAEKEIHGPK